VTSYDNAAIGQGNIVNQVQMVYNNFAQATTEYQSHSGAVNMATTPKVQYGYADGSANTVRPASMTYPNGRVLNFNYGSGGGINDAAGRVGSLLDNDGATQLASYSYLGRQNIVLVNSPQPGLQYTLAGIASGNDADTGDIYHGLDRFSRIKDVIWLATGSSSSSSSSSGGAGHILERIQHGYDRAHDRLWRAELADPLDLHDELYSYDGIHRLKELQRGSLAAGNTAVSARSFAQCWSLDETGNWSGFQQSTTGTIWDVVQNRTSNPANEISIVTTSVGPAWVTPTYDKGET